MAAKRQPPKKDKSKTKEVPKDIPKEEPKQDLLLLRLLNRKKELAEKYRRLLNEGGRNNG